MDTGKCMAQSLKILGVWPSVDVAVQKLDAASDRVLAKRRREQGDDYPERQVRVKGEEWCSEAVKEAVSEPPPGPHAPPFLHLEPPPVTAKMPAFLQTGVETPPASG